MSAALRQRRVLWAIGLLAMATAAASALVYGHIVKSQGAIGKLGSALPGFAVHAADITQYLITTPEGAYRLSKGGARWVLMERGGYPAAAPQIQALAAGLVNLKLQRVLTRDPKKFDALRLSDPRQGGSGTLIQATDASGAERASLLVGHTADDLLLRQPGTDIAYVASGALPTLSSPAAFADLDALRINPGRIQRVDLIYPNGQIVTLERPSPDSFFALSPKQKNTPAGFDKSSAGMNAIALGVIPFRPMDVAEQADGTLDGEPLGKRQIMTFDRLSIRMAFSKRGDSVWATASAGGGGSSAEAIAINSRTSGWAFVFPLSFAEGLFPGAAPAAPAMTQVSGEAELEAAGAE